MFIIWRGAGILIPIVAFISGWIVSYWFEDTSLGNAHFMKWTLLWSGILITLFGLGAFPLKKDPNTDKWHYVGNHDFFWIPMIVWGIGFLGFSIKMFITAEPEVDEHAITTEVVDPELILAEKGYFKNLRELKPGERAVKFYNPTDEPIEIDFYEVGKEEDGVSGEIPGLSSTFSAAIAGDWVLAYADVRREVAVTPSTTIDSYDSDELWLVLGENIDLLLVDATETCYEDLTRETLAEVDWMEWVIKRYDGATPIDMRVETIPLRYFRIRDPYYSLPTTHTEKDQTYAVVPIPMDVETSDAYLDEYLSSICFKTEGVTVH